MSTRRKTMKLATVVATVASLGMAGTSTAAVEEDAAADAAAGRCGTGVYLDGLRALDVTGDPGDDELRIEYLKNDGDWAKLWPRRGDDVSMGDGDRREVDKCVGNDRHLKLVEVDPFADDVIDTIKLQGQQTRDYIFCCGDGGRYRLGALR